VPDAGVGELVFPDLEPVEALSRLERELLHVLRLDEKDPIAVWRARADTLVAGAARMTERRFDALHLEGPGTDLDIGLLRSSRWQAAGFSTVDGLEHMR
jgi:aminopeptidase